MASERFNLWAARLILGSFILGGASPLLGADRSAIPGAVWPLGAVQPQSEQVQTSFVQPSDEPKVFGVKPVHVDIHWTAYYVAPVEKTTPNKGHPIIVVDRQGNKVHVYLTRSSFDQANMEAALLSFQHANSRIPPGEYGNPVGAITLWFLTQAELKFQAERSKTKTTDAIK